MKQENVTDVHEWLQYYRSALSPSSGLLEVLCDVHCLLPVTAAGACLLPKCTLLQFRFSWPESGAHDCAPMAHFGGQEGKQQTTR